MATPDYYKIYKDIILKKYPDKKDLLKYLKNKMSSLDVIYLDQLIFDNAELETEQNNQTHRSYDRDTINYILNYQKKNKLSNQVLANQFKLSRNTVTKWKKVFVSL